MTKRNSMPLCPNRRLYGRLSLALAAAITLFSLLLAPVHAQDAPIHVVQPGETLSEIAQAYGVGLEELMLFNGIADPNDLLTGQRLRVPAPEASALEEAPAQEPATQAPPVAATQPATYTVQPGDSLSQIAKDLGVTLRALQQANGIGDADRVVVGQVLAVPADGASTGSTGEGVADSASTGSASGASTGSASEGVTTSLNGQVTVRSGDTLTGIALRYGVDVRALRAINGLEEAGNADLAAGQVLILPATAEDLRVIVPAATYEVRPGDSLGQIAKDHEITLAALLDANGIRNPDLLAVGQQLVIPPPADAAVEQPPAVGPQRRGFYSYTVQPGDTLSELAKAFDSTMLALLEFNDLPDEQTVYAGLELRIPFGAPPLPQVAPPAPLSGTSFLVSLSRQECWLFEGAQVRERWTCSTGYGEWITRTGTFNVQTKLEVAQSNAYRLDMPYWLGIYDVGEFENGIHGLPIDWDTGEEIWDGLIGQPATFGCAMLDNEDAAVLFDRAYLGMPIHVLQ